MIDIKIGEKPNTNQNKETNDQQSHNHNEDNILAQIRFIRDKQIEHNEREEKQNLYRNLILIGLLIISIIIAIKV